MKRFYLPYGQQMLRNKFVSFLAATIVLVSAVLIVQSCKPDPDDPDPQDPPEITSLSITEGQAGATVTINGKNFKDGTDGVKVFFGTHEANVSSSTATTIVCTVPNPIPEGTYNVVVSIDGQSSAAFASFTVKEATVSATVTSFDGDNGSVGDPVTIIGSNFGNDQDIITVTINEVEQEITAFSDNSITIELKPKTFSGELVVWKDGVKYPAPLDYNYQEKYFVGEFGSDKDASAIVVDNDSNVYIANLSYLTKWDKYGNLLKTIIDNVYGTAPYGLFLGANDTLYISDGWGRILYLIPGEDVVDTLVHRFEDPNIKGDFVWDITGDNLGNLYISSGSFGFGVIKYNLYSSTDSEIIFETSDDAPTGTILYHDNRIYVNVTKGIYSFNVDGTDVKKLVNIEGFNRKYGLVFYNKLNRFIVPGLDNPVLLYLMDINGAYEVINFESTFTKGFGYLAIDLKGDIIGESSTMKKIEVK